MAHALSGTNMAATARSVQGYLNFLLANHVSSGVPNVLHCVASFLEEKLDKKKKKI